MHQSNMNLPCRWEVLFISLWIQVGFVPGTHCKDGTVGLLSKEDTLLLKDDPNPKCFTRTEKDFTCFFETADNGTYDFFYTVSGKKKKKCEMSVQRTEEGTFNHICSFPSSDVLFYVETDLEVVERNTNASLFKRAVSPEDHILLDPPFNISLHQNDLAGQLQVSWQSEVLRYQKDDVRYRIRYSSKGLGEKIKEVLSQGDCHCDQSRTLCKVEAFDTLDSLTPGEEVEVQVSVQCVMSKKAKSCSSWSNPARAVVPQSADDISLTCFTSDLQNVSCQWNGSRYGAKNEYTLLYRTSLGEASGWTNWTECLAADGVITDLCRFRGNQSERVRVKLSGAPAPLGRTFYTQEFTLNHSIKTPAPSHLTGALENDSLCVKWGAPLQSLSAHMQYEVSYQTREKGAWMTVHIKAPETGTCLTIPSDSQYSIKCRAKATGSIYSGHWSDWSDVLTGRTPAYRDTLLILCIPALMLLTAIILISLFPKYLRKLKLIFWPPVPNLDKVLQGFLTELNGQKWNPPLTAKQCFEESASSVVEVMSEDEVSELGKLSEESIPDTSYSSLDPADGGPGTEVFPDYVTLNKGSIILCPKGNNYVEEKVGEKEGPAVTDEIFQTCHSPYIYGSLCAPPAEETDFLNHSYLPMAEPADGFDCKFTVAHVAGNFYTNLPCS